MIIQYVLLALSLVAAVEVVFADARSWENE